MKGLLLRLSALDANAENAVRVISFFDELVAGRVDVDTLVRAASQLAECPTGIGEPVPATAAVRYLPDGTPVWLGRSAPGLALDEILLERLAIAAAILLDHTSAPPTGLGDAALVELALSTAAGEAERSRALHLLGLRPQAKLAVLASVRPLEVGGHTAELGALHAVLLPGAVPDLDLEADMRVGVATGTGIDAPEAWRQARTAVRFAGYGPRVVRWADLGALAVLASLRLADIAEVEDVAALDRLAEDQDTIEVLKAFCVTDSVRKAAALVYRHHSTVAARLVAAEARLGFSLSTTEGRRRLDLALVLRHLRETAQR
ncbi:helix-turn-helix domain-containing protein [Actinophytocola sp.]|uniref:helix-turn-helix domain-containing protein n=1 Tax=Actinophytocola sp. TaxID=1872138 RepID=UPI002ED01906